MNEEKNVGASEAPENEALSGDTPEVGEPDATVLGAETAAEADALPCETEEETVDYARLAAEDLAEIKRLDPAYAPASHLGDLPFARRFAELRDLGLSVREALAAASPRFERQDGRTHLRAIAPRGARAPEGTLDRERMREAKMLFDGLSESEINALYRRVSRRESD